MGGKYDFTSDFPKIENQKIRVQQEFNKSSKKNPSQNVKNEIVNT